MHKCIYTSCSERVIKCVRWCSQHPSNVYLHAWCPKHQSKCMHTLRKKCICARACAHMQRCRSFFAMKAIANLSWVLCEHRAGCRCRPPNAVSTKPVARCSSLKKSVIIHASSWRDRRCGVAQASSSALVQASSSLSISRTCAWLRSSVSTKFYFRHGFRGAYFALVGP